MSVRSSSHDPTPLQPTLRAPGAPSAQLGGAFALEEVDDDASVQIDEARGVDGRVLGSRREVGVLVDAESTDPADPVGVIDEGSAVEFDRRPGGVPAHPVLGGHRGDGSTELAHLAGDLGAGSNR